MVALEPNQGHAYALLKELEENNSTDKAAWRQQRLYNCTAVFLVFSEFTYLCCEIRCDDSKYWGNLGFWN